MLSIVNFLLDVLQRHVIWLYAVLALFALWYVRGYGNAHADRMNTIFPVEREVAAHKEGRALTGLGTILGMAALVTAVRFYIVPGIDITKLAPPTPTVPMVISTAEPTPSPTPTASAPTATVRPSPTRRPTAAVTDTPVIVATSTPRPAPCPNPEVCIAYPGSGATISGIVGIQGTAQNARFQFYKVEYGIGEAPTAWNSIGEIITSPVSGGPLMALNTQALPNGVYWLRLTVVDITGNYPPPHAVRVIIQN